MQIFTALHNLVTQLIPLGEVGGGPKEDCTLTLEI